MPVDRPGRWVVSRRTGWRGLWGAVGVLVFGAAAVAAVVAFVREPHIDSGVLVLITVPFLVMAVVLAIEGLGQGLVRVDASGYATPLGRRRAWADVLAVGTGLVEGQETPVVALRSDSALGVEQEAFPGFAGEEAATLVEALSTHASGSGFSGVEPSEAWWEDVEAEAERVASVVRTRSGREPLGRERIPFGFGSVPNAVRLYYGRNSSEEHVDLIVHGGTELALTVDGRRYLRQHRKRSGDAAEQLGLLFATHTTDVVPTTGAGFDRLRLRFDEVHGVRPMWFNAEEPDRF